MIHGCLLKDDDDAEPEDDYYQDFTNLKHEFIDSCMVVNKYEVHKLWAHWLIRKFVSSRF